MDCPVCDVINFNISVQTVCVHIQIAYRVAWVDSFGI